MTITLNSTQKVDLQINLTVSADRIATILSALRAASEASKYDFEKSAWGDVARELSIALTSAMQQSNDAFAQEVSTAASYERQIRNAS